MIVVVVVVMVNLAVMVNLVVMVNLSNIKKINHLLEILCKNNKQIFVYSENLKNLSKHF